MISCLSIVSFFCLAVSLFFYDFAPMNSLSFLYNIMHKARSTYIKIHNTMETPSNDEPGFEDDGSRDGAGRELHVVPQWVHPGSDHVPQVVPV